ncbi:hypothetical protein [Leptospira noguchii]|uniref:hypothetical protein n=1 Tax=Leptospira noguchii TaxID=28182 RepID=UPI003D76796D
MHLKQKRGNYHKRRFYEQILKTWELLLLENSFSFSYPRIYVSLKSGNYFKIFLSWLWLRPNFI